MQFEPQSLAGLLLLKPTVHYDHRGYFVETYHKEKWLKMGIDVSFVQDNQSYSTRGTVRGLHYQIAPYAQAKLVRVAHGTIWDVVVDLRSNSDTFGQWQGYLLSSHNHHQLLVPKGFAHGFIAVSKQAIVAYQCDAPYCFEAERGIHFQDPTLHIPWERYAKPKQISTKDAKLPLFVRGNPYYSGIQ